ncbi:hypothetical protein [Hymenobacter sp. BT730]|uniref:hypothetical protein n=1 Tax=Hymenobacter sp. BT730 TaxID=3063332 RepID=UPI0026E0D406|nr:hypothetical protein [Hymenobacter sp. BT730]
MDRFVFLTYPFISLMMFSSSRILLAVLLLVGSFSARIGLAQKASTQYMQIFYSGSQTTIGPVIRFSPEFKAQKEVSLAKPDEFMKLHSPTSGLLAEPGQIIEATVTTTHVDGDGNTYIDGKKQTSQQLEKLRKQGNDEQMSRVNEYARIVSEHNDNVTSLLSKALNDAAADGWEVVEMASIQNGGLVYLLRKGKK